MATERHGHQKWFNEQVAVLVDLGVDLVDAERRQQWILDNLPSGADPATHIFDAIELMQDPSAPENVQDSAAAYMADDAIAPKWKRLLTARQEQE